MAVNRSSLGQLLHVFARFVGVTGAIAALVGWFLLAALAEEQTVLIVVIAGLSAVALALIAEVRSIARMTGSRRGVFGLNVLFQVALLLGLVGAGNYFAFHHYRRFDLTHDQRFTLPQAVRDQLAKLEDETDIVVVSFGQRGKADLDLTALRRKSKKEQEDTLRARNQQEKIELAAQRKIIEKVRDLAEQFQDVGPRFRVHVLDMSDDGYDRKLAELKTLSANLIDTIFAAPDNSVFFFSRNTQKIQRLDFNEIYRINTQASIDGDNLVLQYQGEKSFLNKILHIEEKKPRIANAIVHPLLGLEDKQRAEFTMAGARHVLDEYGFDSKDLVLRVIADDGDLTDEATALTHDESRFARIEDELAELEDATAEVKTQLDASQAALKDWSEGTLTELNKKYVYVVRQDGLRGVALRKQVDALRKSGIPTKFLDVDEDDRRNSLSLHRQTIDIAKHLLENAQTERENLTAEKQKLKAEDLREKKRMTDIEARMNRVLGDVDLLIVPRLTILSAPRNRVISNRAHQLDAAQFRSIKRFLKSGKPILFLLGPTNEPGQPPDFRGTPDDLEIMLAEFGFRLPRQTVLYNIETREFNERKFSGPFGGVNRDADFPSLRFDDVTISAPWSKTPLALPAQPIRSSMKTISRTAAKQTGNDIRLRDPRPIYFGHSTLEPKFAAGLAGGLAIPGMAGPLFASATWLNKAEYQPDLSGTFLVTRSESWNEDAPFLTKNKVPRFAPSADDPRKGTPEEVRRGPFPIGVAIETTAPAYWRGKDEPKLKTTRLAVIGTGGAFVGPELNPLHGKMLVDVTNWLLGRDDLLAREAESWQFPRADLVHDGVEYRLWQYGAAAGLPLLFIYLGVIVWMARRVR